MQFLLNISGTFQIRGYLIFATNLPKWDTTFTFYTLFWYQTPFDLEKLKTRIVKKFQGSF